MINLRNTIIMIVLCFFSLGSLAALVPMPEEQDVKVNENSVLPPMGILNCDECVKAFKDGANSADIELVEYHEKQIFGSDSENNSSGAVD